MTDVNLDEEGGKCLIQHSYDDSSKYIFICKTLLHFFKKLTFLYFQYGILLEYLIHRYVGI